MSALNLIKGSPYRTLGVFSNSSRRDLISKKNKMLAFAKLGKSIPPFTLDFSSMLGEVDRSLEGIASAEASINLAKDKLKHALFWFSKSSSGRGRVADTFLEKGSLEKAYEHYEACEEYSAYINRAVISLFKQNLHGYFENLTQLLEDNGLRKAFLSDLDGTLENFDKLLVSNLVIQELASEFKVSDLLSALKEKAPQEYYDSASSILVESMLSHIDSEVASFNAVSKDDREYLFKNAKRLVEVTKDDVQRVKQLLPSSHPGLQCSMDALAKALMRAGSDYLQEAKTEADCSRANFLLEEAQAVACTDGVQMECVALKVVLDAKIVKVRNQRYFDPIEKASERLKTEQGLRPVLKYLDDCSTWLTEIRFLPNVPPALYKSTVDVVAVLAMNKVINYVNFIQKNVTEEAIRNGSMTEDFHLAVVLVDKIKSLDIEGKTLEWVVKNGDMIRQTYEQLERHNTGFVAKLLGGLIGLVLAICIRFWWVILLIVVFSNF